MAFYESVAAIQEQQTQGEAFVNWNINLPPHIEAERLELNTKLLAGIGRAAGFGGVTFGEYQGEQTRVEAQGIGGIFGDGTAAAVGAGKVTKVESERHSFDGLNNLPRNYQWPRVQIAINRPEITRDIATRTGKGSESHQAWAAELNSSFQRGLRGAAKGNLIPPGNFWNKYRDTLGGSSILYVALPPYSPFTIGMRLGVGLLVQGLTLALEQRIIKQHDLTLADRRWSLFAGEFFQLDRYAAASFLTALPLVRVRKSSGKTSA